MTKDEVLGRIKREYRFFNRPISIDDAPWDRGYIEGYANGLKTAHELVNRISYKGTKIFIISIIGKDFGDFNTVRTYLFSTQEEAEAEFKRLFEVYGEVGQDDDKESACFDNILDDGYFYGRDNESEDEFVVTIKNEKVMR